MPTVHYRLVRHGEEPGLDTVHESLPTPAREVNSTNAHGEQGITTENHPVTHQGYAAQTVSRGMNNLQAILAETDLVSFSQENVRSRTGRVHAEHASKLALIPDEPLRVVAMDGYSGTSSLLDRTVGRDMINVAVSIDNLLDGETKLLSSI